MSHRPFQKNLANSHYFVISKKNWDEESSDEEPVSESEILAKGEVEDSKSRKKRRISRNQ